MICNSRKLFHWSPTNDATQTFGQEGIGNNIENLVMNKIYKKATIQRKVQVQSTTFIPHVEETDDHLNLSVDISVTCKHIAATVF